MSRMGSMTDGEQEQVAVRPGASRFPDHLLRRAVLMLAAGIGLYAALALVADAPRIGSALGRFSWAALPVALVLTLANYSIRFLKWEQFLRAVNIRIDR